MLIKPKAGLSAKIKVLGIGGGGGNAISSMIVDGGISGVDFIAINTDMQALLNNKASLKIQIGENLTKGLGSGGDPEIGRQAAEESREKIKEELTGADMIFLTCGEGGGTGTGAAPVIAEIAKELDILTIAVVTKPFDFEGAKRKFAADEGIRNLQNKVDTLIIVPNQKVLQIIDKKTTILEAFRKIDSVLHQGVKGIAELITQPGLINVDFADVKSIMSQSGTALMGIGIGSGDKRAMEAIKQAISSPLLDIAIDGAKGVLFNIIGGPDMTMSEIDEAASIIAKTVDPDADIIFGAVIDEKMLDQIKITLVATKFDSQKLKLFQLRKKSLTENFNQSPPTQQIINDVKKLQESAEVIDIATETDFNEKDNILDEFDDDSEFDVPAFLRKK